MSAGPVRRAGRGVCPGPRSEPAVAEDRCHPPGRPAANVAEVVQVVGEVTDRPCIVVDDMIDTAGTLESVVFALKERGATDIYAAATHALLSGPAVARLQNSPVKEVVVSNTLHITEARSFPKLRVLSIAELLARAIRYTHSNESVSSLFD